MSGTANSDGSTNEPEKPVSTGEVIFPPFPDPTDEDFEEDITEEERNFYKTKFSDLNLVKTNKLHCTACDRHLGCAARNEAKMRAHPMLRTLVCHTCHTFYNSGEFDKGDDGSELYCRWCGQGGQVYCCSDCPHVFCAKCIRRNLGLPKIREIENADDWKCFKCNPKCLWDLRALCWALLRYCDLKNKITYKTQDPELKEAYQKDCAVDHSECCKHKINKRKENTKKREEKKEVEVKKSTASVISKIPPTIQVKKFASINIDESKQDKKAQKRSISPKNKPILIKAPLSAPPGPRILNPIAMPPLAKKIRMPNAISFNPIRIGNMEKKPPNALYSRIRSKPPHIQPYNFMNNPSFNGLNNSNNFNNMGISDNINLSLESLTQGLDMAAVAALASNNSTQDDDVVCTPDFPLEPLCEVTEDNTDDDVQCITPGPVAVPKINTPPPLVPRVVNPLSDLSSDNIIQMTENDVTVNTATGGLKFRVDPQTLSSNKMYRLPDGRIFAINPNPNMPGGYSATIVAVTENMPGKVPAKGATYAAKLSAVSSQSNTSTPNQKQNRNSARSYDNSKGKAIKATKGTKGTDTSSRECDLEVPVEWFRYNLIDAVDALEYSLSRLHKIKKQATSMYLRTRTVPEMKNLHKTLERLLNTSSTRFNEIRDNLNKELKQYVLKKMGDNNSDDDDDVEILNDVDNDDPIFIDENSTDSNVHEITNCNESQEVDLTGVGSSEHNDSAEQTNENFDKIDQDPLCLPEKENQNLDKMDEDPLCVPEKENDNLDKMDQDPLCVPVKENQLDVSLNNTNDESLSRDNNDKNDQIISDDKLDTIYIEKSKCQESNEIDKLTCSKAVTIGDISADRKGKEIAELQTEEKDASENEKMLTSDQNGDAQTLNETNDVDMEPKNANKYKKVLNDDNSTLLNDNDDAMVLDDNDGQHLKGDNDEVKLRNDNNDDFLSNDNDNVKDGAKDDTNDNGEKNNDTEMSDELIETLLKDENEKDGIVSA